MAAARYWYWTKNKLRTYRDERYAFKLFVIFVPLVCRIKKQKYSRYRARNRVLLLSWVFQRGRYYSVVIRGNNGREQFLRADDETKKK